MVVSHLINGEFMVVSHLFNGMSSWLFYTCLMA